MSRFAQTLTLGIVVLAATLAKADTIAFTANGLLTDGAVIGGTLTVNNGNGLVLGSTLYATGPDNDVFTTVSRESHQSYGGTSYDLVYLATANGSTDLAFSVSPSFTGFTGGNVNGGNVYYPGAGSPYGANISFLTLSQPAAVTPEPSSLLLLGTALPVWVYGVLRQRAPSCSPA